MRLSKVGAFQSRRQFLGRAGATIVGGAVALQELLRSSASAQEAGFLPFVSVGESFSDAEGGRPLKASTSAFAGVKRANRAFKIRLEAARRARAVPIPPHPNNGDENRYPNYIGSYSKGLRHNANGEVDTTAYRYFLSAIHSGRFDSYEQLSPFLGCPDPAQQRPFVNPGAANAYDLEGTDPGQLAMRPAPAFSSAEQAGEMVELYWMSLLRDVNFDAYDDNPIAQEAANDLSKLVDFRGPKEGGRVTTRTLFRDVFPGCTTGPYLSQFLLHQTNLGAQFLDQRIVPSAPGTDYMTTLQEWLDIQNGCAPANLNIPTDTQIPARFLSNGRDMSQYVRLDFLYQAYFVATVLLLNGISLEGTAAPPSSHFPFDTGNPYGPTGATRVQTGFGTFGGPHIATIALEPATRALKAVWFQKWNVHRRLRPEAFGGRVEVMRQAPGRYPIHPDLLNSSVLPRLLSQFGSYLLPQAFPEGSPLHPSYASGHATVAGACVTVLKALFDENTVIQNPVQINPTDGGQTTISYQGPDLTVGGELNKLASNIATARNIAGVHWRTDGVEGIKLGEAIGISMLKGFRQLYAESYDGFSLTKFDGTTIKVS